MMWSCAAIPRLIAIWMIRFVIGYASSAREPFFLHVFLARAQQLTGKIIERRGRKRRERQWPCHLDRRKTEPRGEQSVEHPLPETRRQPRRDAMAEQLLNETVGGRHAAGQSKVRKDEAKQSDHAERAGSTSIETGQFANERERSVQDKQQIDGGARADR